MKNFLNTELRKGKEVFIADTARVIGHVDLGDEVSIWFGAVLRADGDSIQIGSRTNIQDNAVVHVDPGFPVKMGHDCIVGHAAIVHGAQLSDHVLVGMGATIMNGCQVGEYSIIAASALLTENTIVPPYSLVAGVPGKVIKTLTEAHFEKIRKNAESYVNLSKEYLDSSYNSNK